MNAQKIVNLQTSMYWDELLDKNLNVNSNEVFPFLIKANLRMYPINMLLLQPVNLGVSFCTTVIPDRHGWKNIEKNCHYRTVHNLIEQMSSAQLYGTYPIQQKLHNQHYAAYDKSA